MSDWNIDATKSSLDVDEVLQGYQSERNRTGDPSTYAQALNGGVSLTMPQTYDMVGIKASEVENMRNAVRDYVGRIQSKMDELLNTNDEEARNAFRGEAVAEEVNRYIEKVKTYCENVISGILVFSDKLADIGNAWIEATRRMGDTINTSTGSFSEGTAYTENIDYNGASTTVEP